MTDEAKSTMSEGTRLAISTPVNMGTKSVHSEILNLLASPSEYAPTCTSTALSVPRPATKKMTIVIRKVGTVVYIIYRICTKRSVPVADEARMVVSLNGDILSPK